MQNFMTALLVCTLVMSMVAALYLLCSPIISRWYSAKWRYYIWLIVIIAFIVPFRPHLGNNAVTLEMPAPAAPNVIFFAETMEERMEIEQMVSQTNSAPVNIHWWQVAFFLWITGAVIFLLHHIVRHFFFIKAINRWSEKITNRQILATFEDIKSEMGIGGRVSLHMSPFGSPMAIGIMRPKIYLPTTDMAQSELRFILMHELIHCKRKDLIYKYLVVLATAVHWFNPLIHVVSRAIDMLCEISCDEEVVRDADFCARQSYGEALIGVVAYQTKISTALSTNFYKGKNGTKTRISSIMDTRKKKPGILVACVMVLLIALTSVFAVSADAELAQMVNQDESPGQYVEFGDTLIFAHPSKNIQLDGFNIGVAENIQFESFNITAVDHSQVWGLASSAQIIFWASLPIRDVSLVRFTVEHDNLLGEDVFVQTGIFNVAEMLFTGEALLFNNFTSPYLLSIISFFDLQDQQHFLAIRYFDFYPYFFEAFEMTGQVKFN